TADPVTVGRGGERTAARWTAAGVERGKGIGMATTTRGELARAADSGRASRAAVDSSSTRLPLTMAAMPAGEASKEPLRKTAISPGRTSSRPSHDEALATEERTPMAGPPAAVTAGRGRTTAEVRRASSAAGGRTSGGPKGRAE
ncbi:unnamed protein product, partial [Scytosiphon promiscuus]